MPVDKSQQSCALCQTPFTFIHRRHWCRGCGKTVCFTCASASDGPWYSRLLKRHPANSCVVCTPRWTVCVFRDDPSLGTTSVPSPASAAAKCSCTFGSTSYTPVTLKTVSGVDHTDGDGDGSCIVLNGEKVRIRLGDTLQLYKGSGTLAVKVGPAVGVSAPNATVIFTGTVLVAK
eukprot:PhF_6_TR21941/c0_g1_i1/m.31179